MCVILCKRRDHVGVESLPQVQCRQRDAQLAGRFCRKVSILVRAISYTPHFEGCTVYIVALFLQQARCYGTVYPTAHTNDDPYWINIDIHVYIIPVLFIIVLDFLSNHSYNDIKPQGAKFTYLPEGEMQWKT